MQTIPWELVRDVVDAVLDLAPAQRTPYLDQACPDPAVRRYVESLVLSYEQAGDFLSAPAANSHPDAAFSPDEWRGRRIGPYQLFEEIGEGGMGAVYRAERADDQYRKQVAVKLVRSGFDSRFTLARFRAERQILANLEHPNIARLLDGGSTEHGQPYFVMEYIQGKPLDEYCDQHTLSITGRLRLFRIVCSAVAYAHQNLVIHRDIKPANILVTDDGAPKLLDFGIAKILDPEVVKSTAARTVTMVRMLTPEYASPEQLRGDMITTASDVYSLGVVLYQLLTGRRPHPAPAKLPEDILGGVADAEPQKPSAAVARTQETTDSAGEPVKLTAEAVSAAREGSPEKLRRRLSGDLDNIVLKALRKEPHHRYASVDQLSEDIRHHLEGLPVTARTDTFAYRAGKFVKRHRAAVVAAVLVALALTTGLAVALREARIARAQRARAERRFNDVRKLANSLIFDLHDSIQNLPGSTAARQLLVQRALEYLNSLSQEAHGDVSLQRELANAYERVGDVQGRPNSANLGDSAGALRSYQNAHSIRKILADGGSVSDRVKYAANCRSLANLQFSRSDAAAAIGSAREALTVTEELSKTVSSDSEVLSELASDYEALGVVLTNGGFVADETEIVGTYQKGLQIDEELAAGSSDPRRIRTVAVDEFHIGQHLRDTGYELQAVDAFDKTLAISERRGADGNDMQAQHDLAAINTNLGDALLMSGSAADALRHYQRTLDIENRLAATDPADQEARQATGEGNFNVGTASAMLGRQRNALEYFRRSTRIFEQALARDSRQEGVNYDLALAHVWTASVLSSSSDPSAALKDYRQALGIVQRLASLDQENTYWLETTAAIHAKMGDFFRKQSQPSPASENYRQAVSEAEKLVTADPQKAEPHYVLADAYLGLGELRWSAAQARTRSRQERLANAIEARSWYQRSSEAWRQIRRPLAVSPDGFAWGSSKEVDRAILRCEATLADLDESSLRAQVR